MKLKQLAIVAIFSFGSPLTHAAAPVFLDDFNSYAATQLNWSPPDSSGWTVSGGGTVDLIGFGGGFDLLPGNGSYVDLDGSTRNAGLFSTNVNLLGGTTYTLSFELAGSQRGSSETVNVNFGSMAASYSLISADPFSTRTLNFIPDTTGSYSLTYQNAGGDNVGALLDNVSVGIVPEPETYALMLAGLGMVGCVIRRRKNNA